MANNNGVVIINQDFSIDWMDLLSECNLKTIGLHSLYSTGGLDGHLNWLLNENTQKLLEKFESNGFTIEHQLHAVDWLLPRSLFKVYPEWFRQNDAGERSPDWNLCVSNADALSFVETSAYKLALLLNQKSHRYYIWSDDCPNSICKCESCRALSGADQNMIIMKHVLKGLKRFDKAAKLSVLSYQDSLGLPSIPPDKDMFLEFAPVDRNHFTPIDGDDESNVRNRNVLEDLLKVFPAASTHILEYYLDVSLFCKWKREDARALNLDEKVLRRDAIYYKSLGVEGMTTFTGFIDKNWRRKYGDDDIKTYAKTVNEVFG
ncbi:MAG: DUF4838 domain-containing protein [Clostridia bacterium]|jgi:hypothetical protein|nr:DUF4838 domain-containing protein [Clostridia bacterium]